MSNLKFRYFHGVLNIEQTELQLLAERVSRECLSDPEEGHT